MPLVRNSHPASHPNKCFPRATCFSLWGGLPSPVRWCRRCCPPRPLGWRILLYHSTPSSTERRERETEDSQSELQHYIDWTSTRTVWFLVVGPLRDEGESLFINKASYVSKISTWRREVEMFYFVLLSVWWLLFSYLFWEEGLWGWINPEGRFNGKQRVGDLWCFYCLSFGSLMFKLIG